ncbi:MAG: alpha/beta hydrolase, partial [Deltaproteobacteria bacterium]|nr:alpha/beta hydrolase [Deltaproteobacteria bacterium]
MPTDFYYTSRGRGEKTVLCLHGLFGSPDNWTPVMEYLQNEFSLIALRLPLNYRDDWLDPAAPEFGQLTDYVKEFVSQKNLSRVILCGNSLGGQVAIDFCWRYGEQARGLILTGSAGLFERNLASGGFIRVDREFVEQQAGWILFNKAVITSSYIDEIMALLTDRRQRLFLVRLAKAASRFKVATLLGHLRLPVLIVWGRQDAITPPE